MMLLLWLIVMQKSEFSMRQVQSIGDMTNYSRDGAKVKPLPRHPSFNKVGA